MPIEFVDEYEVRAVDPERVARVRSALPVPELVEDLAAVFALMGDPGRLRLLVALLEGHDLCVSDLAGAADMSESATSHALRLLRAHGVVKARRDGRMAYYSLKDEHVRSVLGLALEHARHEGS